MLFLEVTSPPTIDLSRKPVKKVSTMSVMKVASIRKSAVSQPIGVES